MQLYLKILIVALLGVAISIFVMLFFIFVFVKPQLQESIGETQLKITQEIMNKIDRILYGVYQDIQIIAETEASEKVLSLLEKGERAVPNREILQEHVFLTGPWDVIYLIDKKGVIIVSTQKEGVMKNVKESEENNVAFHIALSGKFYYSDLVISDSTDKPTIIFAAPVRNEDEPKRPIVGAVMAEFSWPVILEVLEELKVGARLYNSEGVLIGASGKEHEKEILVTNRRDFIPVQHALEGKSMSMIFSGLHGNYESLTSYVPQLGYLGYKGSGWVLLMETPTSVALAPVNELTKRTIILGTILSILFTILSFLLSRQISKPIRKLRDASIEIGKGKLDTKIEVKSEDEMGQLASAFNQMTEDLKKSRKELEKYSKTLERQVKERTKDLKKSKKELEERVNELERFNKLTVGRELKMIELKKRLRR